MILAQQLSSVATLGGARPAVSWLGKETRYSDFKTTVARLSYLYQREIGHHQRIAFLCHNAPAVLTTFFALTNTRSVVIPVDPDLPPEEIAAWLKGCEPTHVAVTSDLVPKVRELLLQERFNLPVLEIEKRQGGEFDTSFTPPPDQVPVDTDPVILFRSAGTTGQPRFTVLNHKQLLHSAIALKGNYKLTNADRFLTTLNWSHPFAFIHGALLPVLTGATCVIDYGLEHREFLDFIAKERVSRLVATPPWCFKLLKACSQEKRLLPGVKSMTVGLGRLSPELRRAFELLKVPVAHVYGQVEAGWSIAMENTQDPSSEKKPAMRPLAGLKYKVLDAGGDMIEGSEEREGSLAVSGPSVMTGYYELESAASPAGGASKETKNALRGTWLYTGDYAKLEGDGEDLKITFLARKEELLIKEGAATFPDVVDAAMRGVAGVIDAAGFTLLDSRNKMVIACAVVKVPKAPVTDKAIQAHLASKLGWEFPVPVIFAESIPRDAGGNVNRVKLRGQFAGAVG